MSLWGSSGVSNRVTHFCGLILLCVGYFNSFLILEPISIFLRISYLTGGILVSKFLALWNFTIEVVNLTYCFFQVLYEDSLVFIKDATEKFTFALALLKQCYLILEKGFQAGCSFIWYLLSLVFGTVEIVSNFLTYLKVIMVSTKEMLHLAGSGIWSFILSIPEMISMNISAIYIFITNSIQQIYNLLLDLHHQIHQSLKNLHLLLFDIPLDSIYGLLVGGIILFVLCLKFKDICLMLFSAFVKLYRCAVSLAINLWTGRFLENKNERIIEEDDERLCVVCQYQLKEIIIFPCKHLCLCWDCSVELVKTQNHCPVCRTRIRETLKVYV